MNSRSTGRNNDIKVCSWNKRVQKEHAKNIGKSIALHLFHDFTNDPTYQGPSFTWEKFPKMCNRTASSMAFMHFPGNVSGLLHSYAGRCAERYAKLLLKETKATP